MWFNNLQIYRMTDWDMTPAILEERLSSRPLQPCLRMEMQSSGWVSPREESENFVHALGQHMLIAFGTEKKLLPATIVNQFAKGRAAEIAQQQGFKPGQKQMRDIKETVIVELLPRAFALRRKTYAWIDPAAGLFLIDTSNMTKAEEFIEILIKTVDKVSLKPLKTKISPSAAMTRWLSGNDDISTSFTIDRHCELCATDDEKATVSYTRHVLDSGEIARHVKAGKEATKLAMTWRDKASFVLHENLQLRRIAPLEILKETAETDEELFDSDFAIMTGELSQLLPDIIHALGGEEDGTG